MWKYEKKHKLKHKNFVYLSLMIVNESFGLSVGQKKQFEDSAFWGTMMFWWSFLKIVDTL